MKKLLAISLFVLGVCISLFTGCRATIADVQQCIREYPLVSDITLASDSGCLSHPLPRAALVGVWKGTGDQWVAQWSKKDSFDIKTHTWFYSSSHIYEFNEDGTFTLEMSGVGAKSKSLLPREQNVSYKYKGTWLYESKRGYAELTLSTPKGTVLSQRPVRHIYWLNENEFKVTHFLNDQDARKWGAAFPVNTEVNVDYSLDNCLNESVCGYSLFGRFWSKKSLKCSPFRFKRVDKLTPQCVVLNSREKMNSVYQIIRCERESTDGFSYRFELKLNNDEDNSLYLFSLIQNEFRDAVRKDYLGTYLGTNSDSLIVDFPEYKLINGKIVGRAVVLTISVASLAYDPNTRTGKLAVKVNANQYEEARKWVRKNIETLARDKNIALVMGEIPPAAKFYLGREEFKDGNILEMEFRTE